jgi:predicted nucleic acid-binding protein
LFYLDTSVLLSLLLPEPRSVRTAAWIAAQTTAFAISPWTHAEAVGALGMKVRLRELTKSQAAAVGNKMAGTLLPVFQEVSIDREVFMRCIALLSDHSLGLRAPDALHLAVCRGLPSLSLVTADRALFRAARKVGTDAVLLA